MTYWDVIRSTGPGGFFLLITPVLYVLGIVVVLVTRRRGAVWIMATLTCLPILMGILAALTGRQWFLNVMAAQPTAVSDREAEPVFRLLWYIVGSGFVMCIPLAVLTYVAVVRSRRTLGSRDKS